MSKFLTLGLCSLLLASCATWSKITGEGPAPVIPDASREFRAVWVATVVNIDWPSKPGLSTEAQKAELIAILDKCKDLNLNAVVLQVRPQCDAMYDSKIEPWSEFLTGTMGKAPDPYYDPLAFAIEEAHKRGMELHGWFNPYRAHHPAAKSPISENSILKKRPELAPEYGNYRWLNPGEKEVLDYSMSVVLDVVKRYDIDGVHIDDYFYPYKSYAKDADFPDTDSFKRYQANGGTLSRNDWRRDNVNRFVKRFYYEVKALKPWVKVGISPFGIARPDCPPGIKGFDQYEELYADAKLWWNEGWLDYMTPQLYWAMNSKQPYRDLLGWWASENTKERHLWPGNGTYRIAGDSSNWPAEEIIAQIQATRKQPGASGNVHFSMKVLENNTKGITDRLKGGVYAEPALIPASPWLDSIAPAKPSLSVRRSAKDVATLKWKTSSKDTDIRFFALYRQYGETWKLTVLPASTTSFVMSAGDPQGMPDGVAISAIDRCGNESHRAFKRISK